MYRAVCPNCGKAVLLEEAEAISCPYCKSEIPLVQEVEAPVVLPEGKDLESHDPTGTDDKLSLANAKHLIECGDYDQLLLLAAKKKGDLAAAYRTFAQIVIAYRDYVRDAEQLYEKESARAAQNALRKFATGTDTYAENPIHSHYMKRVEEKTAELAKLLASPDLITEHVGGKMAAIVAKRLLLPSEDNTKKYLAVVLMADDYSCSPLVSFLEDGDLVEIYKGYTETPDFHLVAPKQFQLKKEMEKEILKRGIELPGFDRGLLSKLKKLFS